MAFPVYSYLVADLRTNRLLDELPLTGVTFNRALNKAGTLRASWPLTRHPSSTNRDPDDLTTPARRALYVLRDDRPLWGGIVWTSDYDSRTGAINLGCADWWSYFDHRLILPVLAADRPAEGYIAGLTVTEQRDQNALARNLIALAQSHTGGDLGIDLDFDPSSSGTVRERTYSGYELTEVGEALRRLSELSGGQDMLFGVAPGSSAPRRVFQQGRPRLSQTGAPWVWEFGGAVVDYSVQRNGAATATRTFASGKGIELGIPIAVREDAAAYEDGWPLLEVEHGYSSVEETATLQGHAAADLAGARRPSRVYRLEVITTADQRVDEITPGDVGQLIIDDQYHRDHRQTVRCLDVAYRVAEGQERVTVSVAPVQEGA